MSDQAPEQDILSSLASDTGDSAQGVGSADDAAQDRGSNGDEQAVTMPLIGGVLRPDDLPEMSESDANAAGGGLSAARGMLLLLLVFAIGVGALCLMRRSQLEVAQGADEKEVEEKIDQALERLATSFAGADSRLQNGQDNTEAIVTMFGADPARQQVPLEFLKKNPFLLAKPVVEAVVEPTRPVSTGRSAAALKQERIDRLKKQFADMHLQTVMGGDRALAIVDGEVVQVGSTIGPFKVKAINKRTVDLEGEGQTFRLKMIE